MELEEIICSTTYSNTGNVVAQTVYTTRG